MRHIFVLQWQRLRRTPFMTISMIALTFIFIVLIGGANMGPQTIAIPIHFSGDVTEESKLWLKDKMEELEAFSFEETELAQIREDVALGNVSLGIKLEEDQYTIIASTENQNQMLVDNHLQLAYWEKLKLDQVAAEDREAVEKALQQPPIKVKSTIGETSGDGVLFDNNLQALFGMTLFFAIYTIVFSLSEVAEEKQRGSWDRLILSPVRKWQIYIGYLGFAFVIGMVQMMLVFLMFDHLFHFDISDSWLAIIVICSFYTFAIVALGMLLIGLVNRSSQLNAVVPIIAVSMAMLGGAYWPSEIVENQVVQFASQLIPVTYAMDALKAVAIYGHPLQDITQPVVILFLMGVFFMGIGINLMERR
ncbi:ABC transporter permease [Gracilibacillus caseinilyticus]|uniref:ABC transporter permease n=1 Tax=Gracilibacillus caseinilyticus TaxID=2932256 RepID=A0ABY4F1M8_9BACI|nr:ABC transporter permease [Gracilibacillus caseinilyticus]UOQ49983.1 ABC transporter permease [Gracilibacillus caseinilyticus]